MNPPSAPEALGSQFVATSNAEQSALAEFLRGVFHADAEVVSFRPDVLHWKYFSPPSDWHDPLSYVVKDDRRIVAHGGVWPLRLTSSSADLKGIHLIDWAASRSAPGTGILLLRRMAEKADLVLTIGGSSDTRAILPRMGARCLGTLKTYAKVVRPWLQFRTDYRLTWKTPLRLLRNSLWTLLGLSPAPSEWEARQISFFDSSSESVINNRTKAAISCRRTTAGLNYILSCPAAKFSAFHLHQGQTLAGYFLLSQVGRQARIVDLRVANDVPAHWVQACNVAARTAAANPATCEVIAGFSSAHAEQALRQCGFHMRKEDPIFCYDPRKFLGPESTLELSLLDGDACFTSDGENPYLT